MEHALGTVHFGPFTFDRRTGELRRDGQVVDLAPQPTKVLALLLSRPGQLVTRDELRLHIWPDTIVEFDHGLNTCIRAIRATLGERAGEPTYVQTVPRRGYRFVAEVRSSSDGNRIGSGDSAPEPVREAPRPRPSVLRRPWVVAAILIMGAAGAGAASLWHRGGPAPRLAVLGFENLSPDAVPAFAIEGLAEEVVLSLAGNDPHDLVVITRGSAAAVRHRPLPEAAAALRASHLLTGTVRSTGGDVVVTASLARVSDQTILWADRYRADSSQLGGRLEDIAAAIAGTLAGRLGGVPVAPRARMEPATRAALLRGRYLLTQGRAREAIEQVTAAVPDHERVAGAQALQAMARIAIGDTVGARLAVDRALRLDPGLAEAHFARAELATRSWWDWATARREYDEALRLEPGRAEFHHSYAYLLSILGEHRAALREIELALDLDPVSPLVNGDVAWLYYFARDYEGAVRQAEVTLALAPDFTPAMHCLMLSLDRRGRVERARDAASTLARHLEAPGELVARIEAGAPGAAVRILWRWYVDTVRASAEGDRTSYRLAYGFGLVGEVDSAFVYLERALRQRSPLFPAIGVDPRFDALRDDARFAGYLERLDLPMTSVRVVER